MKNERFEFPQVIKDSVKGLDDAFRWKIVEYLTENGETSYNTLLKQFNANPNTLTFHLRILYQSAIIERLEFIGFECINEKCYYDITKFGKGIINGLMSALSPSS